MTGPFLMKRLQILGTGCSKCKKLAENAAAAATELGIEFEIVKVTEISEMLQFRVMALPALAVDGNVRVAGRVPSVPELKGMLV